MRHDNEYTLAVMIGITAELLRQVTKAKEYLTLRFNLELKRLKPLGVTDETTD